jgi:DinB family protein
VTPKSTAAVAPRVPTPRSTNAVAPKSVTPKSTPVVAAPTRSVRQPVDLSRALLDAWRVNERINQELLNLIAPHVWRVFPASSKRRNIATTFAHIHNVRCMRIKTSHTSVPVPERLDRAEITPDDARKALAESAAAMASLIQLGLDAGGHVPNYRPDVVAMACGAMVHEAHHRGQIAHWCRELGTPQTPEQQLKLWEWDKLHKLANPATR